MCGEITKGHVAEIHWREHGWCCVFIGGHWEGKGGILGWGLSLGFKVSLSVVFPALDDVIELVTWRESALHIPVSFDLIVGSQEALRHPTFQKI